MEPAGPRKALPDSVPAPARTPGRIHVPPIRVYTILCEIPLESLPAILSRSPGLRPWLVQQGALCVEAPATYMHAIWSHFALTGRRSNQSTAVSFGRCCLHNTSPSCGKIPGPPPTPKLVSSEQSILLSPSLVGSAHANQSSSSVSPMSSQPPSATDSSGSVLHTHCGVPVWLHSSAHSMSDKSSGLTPVMRSFISSPMCHASSSGFEVHTYLRPSAVSKR
mmetsp:Transcript_76048/g.150686  ORF Transcript_76048/g.150686 Transcript_76048/m.150686 type:complete len:221 (-) Transcript_76048:179-841(-)